MPTIQANPSGSKTINVSEEHLETIRQYSLFKDLIDSNGIIDEAVLDKLKFNVRSLLESEYSTDKNLLNLCLDVIYHPSMKAFSLHRLLLLYIDWIDKENKEDGETEEGSGV